MRADQIPVGQYVLEDGRLVPEPGATPAAADLVNHPPHYTQGGIECLDAIKAALGREQFIGYLRGQVIKYTWRGPHKGAEGQDYAKAGFYLDRLNRVLAAVSGGAE